MQYAPAAVMLGMKVAGVQSRSSWGRMLVSDAFSALLMGGVVNTLKQTTNVERPDGSNKHSFPSGHTATAFMTATMFTKEYGHKSPWVGVGAYSVATATGLMRMANNKHWLSDVLTGAGIGILSTEVGYYFADLIFREKGINRFANENMFDRMDKPSFVSLYLGLNIPLSGYDINEEMEFRTSSGSSAGVEGAYFFNPYVGVGGRFTVSNTLIIVNEERAENNTFDAISLCGGSYFSYPLSGALPLGFVESSRYPQAALAKLPGMIEEQRQKIAKLESEIPALQGIIARKWSKADELARLKQECNALQHRIDESMKEAERTQSALSEHEATDKAA